MFGAPTNIPHGKMKFSELGQQINAAPVAPNLGGDVNKTPKAFSENQKYVFETHQKFIQPMEEGLKELKSHDQPAKLDIVQNQLQKIKLITLRLENRLEQLKAETKQAKDSSIQQYREFQHSGPSGIKQLQGGHLVSMELPIDFFQGSLKSMEERLAVLQHDIRSFSLQLEDFNELDRGDNAYGMRRKIGAKQIANLIRRQNDQFIRIAAALSDIHTEKERLCTRYLATFHADGSNPFKRAQQEEDDRKRREEEDLEDQTKQKSGAPPAAAAPAAAPAQFGTFGAPAAAPAFGFGVPAAAGAGAPAFGGFGGFGAPAAAPAIGAFGAPAAAPAAAAGGFAGFGGAPAAAPAAGGFGAPAAAPVAGGFGSFGAPAPAAAPAAGMFGSFGAPAPAAAPAGMFGAPAAPAPAAAGGFGSFGGAGVGGFGAGGFGAAGAATAGFGGLGALLPGGVGSGAPAPTGKKDKKGNKARPYGQ